MGIFKQRRETEKVDSLIGNQTSFEGKIKSSQGIRVDGLFKGNIECEGWVVVGNQGKIEGDIVADNVIIGGEIRGNIFARDRLEITAKGKVRGDIVTSHLVIEEGVIFEGACRMTTEEKAENNNQS